MRHTIVVSSVLAALFISILPVNTEPVSVRGYTIPAKTTVPYTYCIGYLNDAETPSFLNGLRDSPPDLYHLGYQIPVKGALGPTYGHELFTDDILHFYEIPQEYERVEGILRKMRAAGVDRIIPYVFTMAFFGHPETRTGFFHFYDQWEEYRAMGLGPKPAADPSLWSQLRGPDPLGGGPSEVFHYTPCVNNPGWIDFVNLSAREIGRIGYDGMFFDVNTQFCACPHCQEKFDMYLLEKYGRKGLREIFGTDDHRKIDVSEIYADFESTITGTFKTHLAKIWDKKKLDTILGEKDPSKVNLEEDWRLLRCYMQDSLGEYPPEKDFDKFLKNEFGGTRADEVNANRKVAFVQTVLRHEFHEYLESKDLATLLENKFGSSNIKRRCRETPNDVLLWVESQRLWCQSMADHFARLKRNGRLGFIEKGRGDDFYTVANMGPVSTVDGMNKRRVDGIGMMQWAPMADMQMLEEMPQCGMLESGVIVSNIFGFRWAMAAGTQAGTLLYKVTEDGAADLAEAEVAAGGGGALIQTGINAPESRRRWKPFFEANTELWDGGESWAQVGVLFWSDLVFYEWPEHLQMTHALTRVFSETQIPFDLVEEKGCGDLSRYKVLIAPMMRYLDACQIEMLLDYAENGGNLVIVEPFGTEDRYARPCEKNALAEACPKATGFQPVAYGKGKILRLKREEVPERRSEMFRLMEDRGNAFTLSSEFLNPARKEDLEKGIDLGPKFIGNLESAFAGELRWCPKETDPGVYIHPYLIPDKPGRPERLVVHAVNYHIPVLRNDPPKEGEDAIWAVHTHSGEPVVSKDLRITVPLPAGKDVASMRVVTPTEQSGPIDFSAGEGEVSLTLNELRVYKAVVMDLKPKG
ncbi:MAG TPA: beta-galactosidase trimerization domain-containing protein [bacterium]|nr:beta-galactosidase trimerization domain-containing protein [bacterium]